MTCSTELFPSRAVTALLSTLTRTRDEAALSAISMPNGTGKSCAVKEFAGRHPGQTLIVELNRRTHAHEAVHKMLTAVIASRMAQTSDLFGAAVPRAPLARGKIAAERALANWFAWQDAIGAGEEKFTVVLDGAQWLANANEVSAFVDMVKEGAGGAFAGLTLLGDEAFHIPETGFDAVSTRLEPSRGRFSVHRSLIDRLDYVWTVSFEDMLEDIDTYLEHRFGNEDKPLRRRISQAIAHGRVSPSYRAIGKAAHLLS